MEQDLRGLTSEEEGLMTDLEEVYRQWKRGVEAEARREGLEEGQQEGRRLMLLKQLVVRFGALSDAAVARVRTATTAQLDRWTERVLAAGSVEEVLGEG